MAKKPTLSEQHDAEEALLRSLRKHGQVVESTDPDVPLGGGQTHILVKKPGEVRGKLLEKRKSFIKR